MRARSGSEASFVIAIVLVSIYECIYRWANRGDWSSDSGRGEGAHTLVVRGGGICFWVYRWAYVKLIARCMRLGIGCYSI